MSSTWRFVLVEPSNVICLFTFQGTVITFRATHSFVALVSDPDYKHVVERMRKEIDNVVGRDEKPRLQHKHLMPYTEAVSARS